MNVPSSARWRLLVLASHPIQYRAPLYRRLAAEPWLDLDVWYGDDYGVKPTESPWGVKDFQWDTDLLSGYRHTFLRNAAIRPGPTTRFGIYNPGLSARIGGKAPDAIWVSGYATLHSWQSLAAAWRRRIPVLYTSDSNLLAEVGGMKRFVKRAVVGRIYRRIAAFLVTGTTNDRHYEAYGVPESKRFFFPWAIENERFAEEADRARGGRDATRRQWGVEPGRDVVLFVARVAPEKDPATVLDAAERDGNLHVVTVGSGPLEGEIARRAAARIPGRYTALGFVNQSRLPSVYAAGDLTVLPSRFEPWGLVVNEALAAGCPVVASEKAGAAHDLVPETMRFRPGDADDLVRAIGAWRADDQVKRNPVAWARDRVRRFSFEEDARGLKGASEALAGGVTARRRSGSGRR